jgi:hypothetical protein
LLKKEKGGKEIDDFMPDKVELVNYQAHPSIKAPLSPTGGWVDDTWKEFVQDKKNKK